MKSHSERARGARVRASRAKSRVVMKRKARVDREKHLRKKVSLPQLPAALKHRENERPKAEKVKARKAGKEREDAKPERSRAEPVKKPSREAHARVISRRAALREERYKKKKAQAEKNAHLHRIEPESGADTAQDEVNPTVSAQVHAKVEGKPGDRLKKGAGRIWLLTAILVASLGALLWVYTGTGVLNVKNVNLKGNEILDEGYLRSLTGITADTHLLKMDVKAVERALMSEPYVASADVSRRFPNTVVIDVTERKPAGFIFQNGKYHLVDQQGYVLESVDTRPEVLAEIKGLQTPVLYPGVEIAGNEFANASALLGSMPQSLKEITDAVGSRDGDSLFLESEGTVVIYGEPTQLSFKNTIAFLALEGLVDRYGGLEYIDVSFPEHPVIKPYGAS